MIRDIVQIGTPILTQKTETVTDVTSEITQQVITDLLHTCSANRSHTAGLAAPQINHSQRICVVRRSDLEEEQEETPLNDKILWEVMVNPEILELSDEQSLLWEACLSIGAGDKMLYGPVYRAKKVRVKYLSRKGKQKSLSGDGFFSHVIQHEIDHLNGILFLQYISNPRNIWKSKELDDYIEEHDEHPPVV